MSLFAELKRRNVFRVGIAYLVAAWLLLQLTDVLTELLELGPEVGKIVIVLLIVGFVPALIFAWAFEMTPEGVKREKDVDRSQSVTPQTGRTLDRAIIAMLVLVAAYFIYEARFMQRPEPSAKSESAAVTPTVPSGSAAAAPAESVRATPPTRERASIVVLPFVNMSADPEQEYFSDGLSEEILNALAGVENLRVISRTSAFAFKGKDLGIPEIARQLDVSHVLEGSVRTAADSVRITAQLIEVDSDSHLWSQAYSRKLENIFEIQEEISRAIAGQLQVRLADSAGPVRPTTNLEAYQLYLRGRSLYQARGTDQLHKAVRLLQQALALDPGFAAAEANLAAAALVLSYNLDEGYAEYRQLSSAAAGRALALDPDNGLARAVSGLSAMSRLDFELAASELNRAIQLNPNESNSLLWKGIMLAALGYTVEAIEVMERAEAVDPLFANLLNWLSTVHYQNGDLQQGRAYELRARELNLTQGFTFSGNYALATGDLDGAEQAWLESAQLDGIPAMEEVTRQLFKGLREPSKKPAAIAALRALDSRVSYRSVVAPLLMLGDAEGAIASFDGQLARERGLRAATNLSAFWDQSARPALADPALIPFFERTGVADFWRKHGDPDLCRVKGATIECGLK